MAKNVAGAALGYYGWYLVVKTELADQGRQELAGKKVGITSAGSGTDILALWTQADRKIDVHPRAARRRRPGAEPALRQHRRHRALLAARPTRCSSRRPARSLIDYGAAVPPHMTGAWIATDKFIKDKPQVLQKTLNALYGGLAFLQDAEEPRRGRQADRRDRRDPAEASPRPSSTATSSSCRTTARCRRTGWSARSTWRG